MIRLLLKLRWLAAVIAVFAALDALAMMAVAVVRSLEAYQLILGGPPWEGEHRPGVRLVESIDAFLISMVFLVFSIGVTTLFLAREGDRAVESMPAWIRVHDLAELKFLVWEAILAALVVATASAVTVATGPASWTALILPATVLLLAVALFLTRRSR